MTNHRPHVLDAKLPHGTLMSYTLGFFFSVLLTLAAFWTAPYLGIYAFGVVVAGAILQIFVQLYFFLHIGSRDYPRSNLLILVFAGIIISILVGGTLWIMSNLAHLHMHAPTTQDLYQGGIVAPQNELR
ncbi:MAG TPA: cytochrome C oxidase subunit IV family protein [Candidatus Paceibacterota bacterium]|nr:cytochrome C oxidase subunit IV family protein [Candidatus Paceibacterota bacterium]